MERAIFQRIKDEFVLEKVIAIFNPELSKEVLTDASDYTIGAEYAQRRKDRRLRLIAFFLKKFLGAELNYEIYNKELLVIIRAIDEQRHYLERTKY